MEFHISRAVRQAAQVDETLFGYTGNVVFANVTAARKLAAALNSARGEDPALGPNADPASQYNAGALFAMGLIDELSHALIARYRKEIDPAVLAEAVRFFSSHTDAAKLDQLLLEFTTQFPNAAIFRNQITPADWLARTGEDGLPNREAALEELLLLSLANANPAFKPFQQLFEDKTLRQSTVYPNVTAAFPDFFATRPPLPEIGSLYKALRAPIDASPDSLTGQLDFIREHWSPYLGPDLRRILLAIDTLREEDIAIWLRFNPPGPDQFRHGAPTWGSQGFEGDEFTGFDADIRRRRKYDPNYQAPLDEYEAFSADQAWMPNVVLIAKSTYVWLEQLSKKYGRHIHRLDHIPDEELHLLSARGITGLWLIGLWERSVASQTIKRLRGHHDAVASAYSLKSYDIAEDLGGWAAYDHLKHAAARAGLRLASDMVPNHMGIDSPWVIDHPDWFIHRWESPFPAYSFNGPDLSTDHRVEIKLDDHYYDQTDAAVAFRLRHHASGETRFIYHGNDGTTFAWNDTAQLDYSKAYVREHVIQVILHVARLFPIIRFDAAMVLAKRHVQRLWFPLPGAGGSIPSRAENAMSQDEFDAIMPNEFWREVVDRVAAEVPGTLLLAEAFWMLEGYFVRTLGMHRVYNSAFMNMLRDEENAKYRSYLKKTIEFDPDILKRYVNFMSNPDERTAIDQFGDGDKCFGVATLMATLPGLPMFGHGQIEGFTERYGMEYKTAKMDERPKDWLVDRHQREIAPLLKKRYIFAGSANFLLYDFWTGYGTVNENVFAYSNRHENERSLVVYNNKYENTSGTIHLSVADMDKGSGQLRQRSIAEGLDIPWDDSLVFAYKDPARNLEYLRRASDIRQQGMSFDLHGFECRVLLNWRELRSTAEYPWDRLCDELHGMGVQSLDYELSRLRLRPLHHALAEALSPANIHAVAQLAEEKLAAAADIQPATAPLAASKPQPGSQPASQTEAQPAVLSNRSTASFSGSSQPQHKASVLPFVGAARSVLDQLREHHAIQHTTPGKPPAGPPETLHTGAPQPGQSVPSPNFARTLTQALEAAARLPLLAQSFTADWPARSRPVLPGATPETRQLRTWAPILAYILLRDLPWTAEPGHSNPALAHFDRLLLRSALSDLFASLGMQGEARWQAAAQVRLLLTTKAAAPHAIRSSALFTEPDARWLAGVNQSEDHTWFNKEQFDELLTWLQLPALLDLAAKPTPDSAVLQQLEEAVETARKAAEIAGYNLDRFVAPARTPTGNSIPTR